jgi:hypothetical protein
MIIIAKRNLTDNDTVQESDLNHYAACPAASQTNSNSYHKIGACRAGYLKAERWVRNPQKTHVVEEGLNS